jgi:hypothetical protein
METLTLNTGDYILIDGEYSRPHYLDDNSNILVYMLREPNPELKLNRAASKLCGYKIYGAVIFVNNNIEEVPNEGDEEEGGAPATYDEDEEEEDGATDGEQDAYIEKNADFSEGDLYCLLHEHDIHFHKRGGK